MKVLFRGRLPFLKPTGIALLCIVISFNASAQEKTDSHKLSYGLHAGFMANTVDLYSTLGGSAQALEQGNHTVIAPGFRIATILELQLSNNISLRTMPGVSFFKSNWKPTGITLPTSLQLDSYKMESVCGELPVDVKLTAIRWGDVEPYLVSGLSYRYDFASSRSDNERILPLNAHDLNFSFGFGLDWYTRYLKVGFEFKGTTGLLSPGNGGSDPFYFHNGGSLSIGLNFEA